MNRRRALMAQAVKSENVTFLTTALAYTMATKTNNGIACQGGCVVGNNYYAIAITSDSATQYLYRFNMVDTSWTLLQTYSDLGHANDMSYNPDENVFYVATQNSATGIAVLDGSDYSIKNNILVYNENNVAVTAYTVCYDRKRKQIYTLFSTPSTSENPWTKLWVLKPDGTRLKIINADYVGHSTHQCIETDGQYLYQLWASPNYIDVFTVSGKYIKSLTVDRDKEVEALAYDWNGRFYCHEFTSNGNVRLSAVLFRSFDGRLLMSYVPLSIGTKKNTNGVVTYTGVDGVYMKSNASASYNIFAIGAGYPFGYSYLSGKKCRVSMHLKLVGGPSGSTMSSNIFTANSDKINALSGRLFQKTYNWWGYTVGQEEDVSYEFTMGQGEYVPSAGNEGTYVGYLLFLYANANGEFEVTNYKFEVEV